MPTVKQIEDAVDQAVAELFPAKYAAQKAQDASAKNYRDIFRERGEQQVVATTVDGRPCTRRQLTDAFNRVASPVNWKFAIDTTLTLEPLDREVVREAVIFFTGSVPKFEYAGCCGDLTCRVTAAGYYATCGA